MHNRALHDSLAAFVEEAAWQLAEEISGGAEVPFEGCTGAATLSACHGRSFKYFRIVDAGTA